MVEFLPKLSIDVVGKSTFCEVTAEGLVVQDREGQRNLISGETVIFAAGMSPNTGLKDKLKGQISEVYEIGDCIKAGHIVDAVHAAARIARDI